MGATIGDIKGDTRSLDYSSNNFKGLVICTKSCSGLREEYPVIVQKIRQHGMKVLIGEVVCLGSGLR